LSSRDAWPLTVNVPAATQIAATVVETTLPSVPAGSMAVGTPRTGNRRGIFIEEGGRMILLEASAFETKNTGGMLKLVVSQGFWRGHNEIRISPRRAEIRISSREPVFYFHLETSALAGMSHPGEFVLVKANVDDDMRKINVGKTSMAGLGGNSGVDENQVVPFISERLGDGVFKVTPQRPLTKGEYCFLYPAQGGRVFDFGVD
jgi:hypothetical protein